MWLASAKITCMAHSRSSSVWFTMHGVLWWDALLRMIIGQPPRARYLSWTDHYANGAGPLCGSARVRSGVHRKGLRSGLSQPDQPITQPQPPKVRTLPRLGCARAHIPIGSTRALFSHEPSLVRPSSALAWLF